MKRAVAAVALIGLAYIAPYGSAAPLVSAPYGIAPAVRSSAPPAALPVAAPLQFAADDRGLSVPSFDPRQLRSVPVPSAIWLDPSGTFRFDKPKSWQDIDTASEVGAAVLVIVTGDKNDECWFTRVPRAGTATLSPNQVIKNRTAAMTEQMWSRVGASQHLLAGAAEVRKSSVLMVGVWPVQTAWFNSPSGPVFAALHSRPGVDVWAFCAAKDGHRHDDLLRRAALSVTTPRDLEWERLVQAQANLTAVP